MEVYSVLVTGANRGIGLEFVRQLVRLPKPPTFIFATYRSSDTLGALTEIKNSSKGSQVVTIKLDVLNHDDIVSTRKVVEQTVGENGLTLLVNNSGMLERKPFPEITEENLLKHFTVNTVGPLQIVQEFLPLLQKAAAHNASKGGMRISRAAVINISSIGGCIQQTGLQFPQGLTAVGYKVSKAGLNMAMRVVAANVKEHGILVIMMCPGWVKTDMGSNMAQLTPEDSISAMLKTFENLNESHHGSFMDRNGELYPF